MNDSDQASFREFAKAAIPQLHRMAVAVCGRRTDADDLVQTTLEKMYSAWPRIERRQEAPMGYARTVLVRTYIDTGRRSWSRAERTVDRLPERAVTERGYDQVVETPSLILALRALTERQGLVVVLRHVEGLPVAEVARALGMSESNVKSASAEGLARLRDALAEPVHSTQHAVPAGTRPERTMR